MRFRCLASQLLVDDGGQDLIEYGLLAALIAIAGILVIPGMVNTISDTYSSWGTGVNNAWEAPEPSGP